MKLPAPFRSPAELEAWERSMRERWEQAKRSGDFEAALALRQESERVLARAHRMRKQVGRLSRRRRRG